MSEEETKLTIQAEEPVAEALKLDRVKAEESVEELSTQISHNTSKALGQPAAKGVIGPILIELLPILADLLLKNCDPEGGADGLIDLKENEGFRGRVFRWRYKREVKNLIDDTEEYNDWGREMSSQTLETLCDPKNKDHVNNVLRSERKKKRRRRGGLFGRRG